MNALVLALLVAGVALHVAPWLPVARRLALDQVTQELRWPPLLLAFLLGFASTASTSYILFILQIYLWVWVLTANAGLAFLLYLLRKDYEIAPAFAFTWPDGKWAKAALWLTLITCLIRISYVVISPAPRYPDSFIHARFLQRLLLDLRPLPGSFIYPLGMHGLEASMALGTNPSSIHLVLPSVNATLFLLTTAWWLQHLIRDQRWMFFALCLLCIAPFNPFSIVVNKSLSPLPQAYAYIFVVALLHELRGFDRTVRVDIIFIFLLGLVSFHSIAALYTAMLLGAMLGSSFIQPIIDRKNSGFEGRPIMLVMILLIPCLVGIFTFSGMAIEWANDPAADIDQTPGFDESHVEFSLEQGTNLIVATVNTEKREEPRLLSTSNMTSVEVNGDPFSVRARPDKEGIGWSLLLTTSHDAETIIRIQDNTTLLSEPPIVKILSSNLSSLTLDATSLNGTLLSNDTCAILRHTKSESMRACGERAHLLNYDLPIDAPRGWHTVEYGWDKGLGFVPVGTIDLWSSSGSDLKNVDADFPNSSLVLREGEPLTVQLLDDRPITATLYWNSTESECLDDLTSPPQLWKNGTTLRLELLNKQEIEDCKGSLQVLEGNQVIQDLNITISAPIWPFPTTGSSFVCLPISSVESQGTPISIPIECIFHSNSNISEDLQIKVEKVSGLLSTESLRVEAIYWQEKSEGPFIRIDNGDEIGSVNSSDGRVRVWVRLSGFSSDRTVSLPFFAGNSIGWVEVSTVYQEGEELVHVDNIGKSMFVSFLSPSIDSAWLKVNWWWFMGSFFLNLLIFLRPSLPTSIKTLAFGGMVLQFSQLTGILSYPTEWGQQRLSQMLVFPLAVSSTGIALLLIDQIGERSLWMKSLFAWPSREKVRQRVLTIVGFVCLFSIMTTPFTPIISESAWNAATSLEDGRYYTEKSANEMSEIGEGQATFLSGGLLLTRWGTGESSLPSWRCARQSFSILLIENEEINALRTWLNKARDESPERWVISEKGDGWVIWESRPPKESIDLWVTRESGENFVWSPDDGEWIIEDELTFREASSQAVKIASNSSDAPGWLCNAQEGTVSPRVNVETHS